MGIHPGITSTAEITAVPGKRQREQRETDGVPTPACVGLHSARRSKSIVPRLIAQINPAALKTASIENSSPGADASGKSLAA